MMIYRQISAGGVFIMKKIILAITNEDVYKFIPETDYDVIPATDVADGNEQLERIYRNLSAVLVDIEFASENDHKFLKEFRSDLRFSFMPAVVIKKGRLTAKEAKVFEHGAVDAIDTSDVKEVCVKRLENAIRITNSRTFDELGGMLKALPSNIFLKDAEGRYVFATHYWHHIKHADDPNWTILGKTDEDIRKDKENAVLAMEADRKVLSTGEGMRYTMEINVDDVLEYLDVIKEPVPDADGKVAGVLGIITDITEQEILKRNLKTAAITDGLTGLYNRLEIERRIEEFIGSPKKNRFSLIMGDIDNFKNINDTYGHRAGDAAIKALADLFRKAGDKEGMPIIAGRWGGEEFMLLVPDMVAEDAAATAEDLRREFSELAFDEGFSLTISFGVTEVSASDTMDTICSRVDKAMYASKDAGKNTVTVL